MGETTVAVCAICERPLSFAWTDHHGIAQCVGCGAPYRLLHYEGEGQDRRSVERGPDLLLQGTDLTRARECFRDTGARLSAVGLGLSFPGGYDIATPDEVRMVSAWWKAHPEIRSESNP